MTVDREINLASVYRVVWHRGTRMLLVTGATVIVAFLATLLMTKYYGAETRVEIKPSRIGERAMSHWVTPIEVYQLYIDNDETMQYLIEEFDLDREPFELERPRDLEDRITVWKFGESSVIEIYTEMETPEMAAMIANALAQRMISKNLALLSQEANTTASLLDQSLSARLVDNASLEARYLEAKREYTIEVLQKHLENLLVRWQSLISQRENLIISTRELATRVASLEQALEHQPEKVELKRTLSEDLVLLEAARKMNPGLDGPDLANLSLSIEALNPEHYNLLSQKDQIQAQLDGDRAKLALIEEMIPQLKEEIDVLQDRIYVGQLELTRLKAEYDRSYEIFSGIDKEYGWAPTTVFSERYDIAVISRAVPDDKPVWPKRVIILPACGALAFFAAFAYFLLKDLYGFARRGELNIGYESSA